MLGNVGKMLGECWESAVSELYILRRISKGRKRFISAVANPERSLYSAAVLDNDSDSASHYEYAYISAALAAVDVDSDGDVDTLYFPVTTTYTPTDEGGGRPSNDVADLGTTWMYKACIEKIPKKLTVRILPQVRIAPIQ